MSNQRDRPFIPFNLSTFVPFDAFAVALNELPTPQLAEPEGEFTTFASHELPTERPSAAVEGEMLRVMANTARDGEWGSLEYSQPLEPAPSHEDWSVSFCQQLNASLRHVQKREPNPSPVRRTPKRPRHSTVASPAKPEKMSPVTRNMVRTSPRPPEKRRLAVRKEVASEQEDVTHEREMRMRKMLKDVDADEFNGFIAYLQRFSRRPQSFLKHTAELDEAILLSTSNESAISELRQRISVFARKGAIGCAEPDLLSGVIAILEKRVSEVCRMCSLVTTSDSSRWPLTTAATEATLGILSAATILAILCAPGSSRRLLVEELLDEIASLLKGCATSIIFPVFDPLYKPSKPTKRRKKNGKKQKHSGRAELDSAGGQSRPEDSGSEFDVKQSSATRRAPRKKDEALLEYFCIVLDALAVLMEKEVNLPDSFVSTVASLCVQSLSVTGIARLHAHAMKTACSIFQSYPNHRLPILDDVREAASAVPAARRHLRGFQLPEDQTTVRAPSALLAQLLCAASMDPATVSNSTVSGKELPESESLPMTRQKENHDLVVKLAMHALDPLLQRAYSDRDVEYRAAFQALFDDILTLYGRPEWPSAELMLQTISVSILTRLRSQDEKTVHARTVSIDILGALAAKMCDLYGSDVLVEKKDGTALRDKDEACEPDRETLLLYLDPGRSRQFACSNALCEALFLSEDLSAATTLEARSKKMAEERIRNDEEDSDDEVLDGQEGSGPKKESVYSALALKSMNRQKRVRERRLRGEEISRALALDAARSIGKDRSFTAGIRTILEAILDGMHDPAPTTRAKSIKALSAIDEACNGIIHVVPDVLRFIEGSCRDVSTLARDAALDLLGKSLLGSRGGLRSSPHGSNMSQMKRGEAHVQPDPTLLSKIFVIVEKRLCDTATSVRKRAISILKTSLSHALGASEGLRGEPMKSIEALQEMRKHETRIIQTCASLVSRLDDPENTVREAAERTLRLGLFGFDISQQIRSAPENDAEEASQLATRFVTVFARLPSGIHVSFISRVVHNALLIKHHSLLTSIVSAVVEQMHDCEAIIARVLDGQELRSLSKADQEKLRPVSIRRVACASVIFAFGGLDDSLVVPHCRSLAPSIKGVNELGTSESDLTCVQKVLNVLEIGFKSSEEFEESFLEETMHDIECIVCTSPLAMLEEAAVKCLCAVAKRVASDDESPLQVAADNFNSFLMTQMQVMKTYCGGSTPEKPTSIERNARGALVRLGLLIRYGAFSQPFVSAVYQTFETTCTAITTIGQRDVLPRAAIRALSHFLIRHRSFLPSGTTIFGKVWSACPGKMLSFSSNGNSTSEGVQLSILQGFHELLRDEEERNSKKKEGSNGSGDRRNQNHDKKLVGDTAGNIGLSTNSEGHRTSNPRAKPTLAAEEDAEAGFLALSAQSMMPCFRSGVSSSSTAVRRMVANILGLLVRQGLLLPATVVTELFTLLLDRDLRCREFSHRVISFLADRHSGMLASAAIPALRVCLEHAFAVHSVAWEQKSEYSPRCAPSNQTGGNRTEAVSDNIPLSGRPIPTVQQIISLTVDERTGHSLLSPALMTMRREQRRGVFESMMREFDPRLVLLLESPTENSNDTRLQDEPDHNLRASNGEVQEMRQAESDGDDDDDVGNVASSGMDLSCADPRCALPTLQFLATTLASLDYTNGAGVGGSLGQGGGTAAAETKLKYAKEDVTELVAIATRIISNSGQAILRVAKYLRRTRALDLEKKQRVAYYASRMSLLLDLKHHLKVERWKPLLSADEAKEEAELSSNFCRMPAFLPSGSSPPVATWSPSCVPLIAEEVADKQLDIFCKLMGDDAIDDADVSVPTRRGGRSARKRSTTKKVKVTPSTRKPLSADTPSPRRVVHRRKASSGKRLKYDEDDSNGSGSDFDPMK